MPLRVTLPAALLHEREREITDTLVELLISTVHRIGARAEKGTEQLINAFKKVSGKENILFKLAEGWDDTPPQRRSGNGDAPADRCRESRSPRRVPPAMRAPR
ncbi:hypothetical protein [Embleya sp. NPDC059237]|uniref:hypothetical protein n=1 Tax=Embleya sp. NPDC059237 TaxID=3346784 RepID=UPI0036BBD362